MHIVAQKTIREYAANHPDAAAPLWNWFKATQKAQWKNYSVIRQPFNSVDYVGNQRYVFNIEHNKHRLVVVIKFTVGMVYIRFVGTHAEYDRIANIETI
jgi:mRNA interferase HigB